MPLYLVGNARTGIAIAVCDRCKMKRFHSELRSDINAPGLKVCIYGCADMIDPYRLPARAPDPLVLNFARPDTDVASSPEAYTGFWNNGGVLNFYAASYAEGYPTDPTGLLPGQVWNNGLTVSIEPGSPVNSDPEPLYFGEVTAAELLFLGGGNLPTTQPSVGSGQLWNAFGEVWVA
ncbi:MAG: hypothetical protein NTX56_04485 [Proteobacteria bacterium]|nr:hypothetical protein [Pseudomonadota bacterium]